MLAKEADGLCGLTTGAEELTTRSSAGGIFPNPLRAGESVFLTEPVAELTQADLIDAGGRAVLRATLQPGARTMATDDRLPAGVYSLLLRSAGGTRHHRLVMQ